jgi:hypothetical protein
MWSQGFPVSLGEHGSSQQVFSERARLAESSRDERPFYRLHYVRPRNSEVYLRALRIRLPNQVLSGLIKPRRHIFDCTELGTARKSSGRRLRHAEGALWTLAASSPPITSSKARKSGKKVATKSLPSFEIFY